MKWFDYVILYAVVFFVAVYTFNNISAWFGIAIIGGMVYSVIRVINNYVKENL